MEIKSKSSVTTTRVDVGSSGEMDCVLIKSAAEMASVLLSAAPSGAAGFARKMHERTCYSQDDERIDSWLATMGEISRDRCPAKSMTPDF